MTRPLLPSTKQVDCDARPRSTGLQRLRWRHPTEEPACTETVRTTPWVFACLFVRVFVCLPAVGLHQFSCSPSIPPLPEVCETAKSSCSRAFHWWRHASASRRRVYMLWPYRRGHTPPQPSDRGPQSRGACHQSRTRAAARTSTHTRRSAWSGTRRPPRSRRRSGTRRSVHTLTRTPTSTERRHRRASRASATPTRSSRAPRSARSKHTLAPTLALTLTLTLTLALALALALAPTLTLTLTPEKRKEYDTYGT